MYKEISIADIKPFVRYSRLVDTHDYRQYNSEICAIDSRLFYCNDGRGEFIIRGTSHRVKNGSLIILPPGTPYSYSPDPKEPMSFIAFNFDYTWECSGKATPIPPVRSEDFEKSDILCPVSFSDTVSLNEPLVIEKMNSVLPLIYEVDNEYKTRKSMYELRCSCLLMCILSRITLTNERQNSKNVSSELIDYIRKNYKEKITLEKIASIACMTPTYFSAVFKKLNGISPWEYIIIKRVEKAISLIKTTEMTMLDISENCGFSSSSNFYKAFSKVTGKKPTDYIKK